MANRNFGHFQFTRNVKPRPTGVFGRTRPVVLTTPPPCLSRTSDLSEAGNAAIESSQRVRFKDLKKSSKGHKSGQYEAKGAIPRQNTQDSQI